MVPNLRNIYDNLTIPAAILFHNLRSCARLNYVISQTQTKPYFLNNGVNLFDGFKILFCELSIFQIS